MPKILACANERRPGRGCGVPADQVSNGFLLQEHYLSKRLLGRGEVVNGLRNRRAKRFKDAAFLVTEVAAEMPSSGRNVQSIALAQKLDLARVRAMESEFP